jgi:DNA primase
VATRDEIERVREATDLVALIGEHVALRPRGREHVGLCPVHDDHRPSFAVVTHKSAAFYKCHSCGAAGDCFSFVQEYLRKEFGETLQFLADRAGIELTNERSPEHDDRQSRRAWLRKAMDSANAHFRALLKDESRGIAARQVIEDRGISAEMIERFQLGCAGEGWSTLLDSLATDDLPVKVLVAAGLLKQRDDGHAYDAFRHRLMFPITDESGQISAFGGRIIDVDDTPKYLNSAENDLFQKSRTLYGLHLARREIISTGRVIVAEGYTDVIACHQAGITNVIGTLGTAMTNEHARTLSRLCDVAVLLFDGDEAGQRAAERAIPIIMAHELDVRICVLPDGLDPDSLLHLPDGQDRFAKAIAHADDAFAFLLARLEGQLAGVDGLSGRQRVLEAFVDSIARSGLSKATPLRRAMLTTKLAELAGVGPDLIADLLRRSESRNERPHDSGEAEVEAMPTEIEVSPVVRRAELDCLAVAIHSGSVSLCPTAEQAKATTDATAHRIACALTRICSESNTAVSMQRLLEELGDSADRTIASDLYFAGERLIENTQGDEAAAMTTCLEALERCRAEVDSRRRMTDWKASADRDPQAAAAVIEHLRGMGPRAAAMPRVTGG